MYEYKAKVLRIVDGDTMDLDMKKPSNKTVQKAWSPKGNLNPAWKGGIITNKEWFYEAYVTQGLSLRQVAKLADRSVRTAARWAEKHGVPIRSKKEACPERQGCLNPNWKGGSSCIECDNENSYGSNLCAQCYYKKLKGSSNPNWKGMSDIKSNVRSYCRKHWSPEILKRDGYKCQWCSDDRGGNLHAHHIKRLSLIVDELIKNLNLDDGRHRYAAYCYLIKHPKIIDKKNGITLCDKCHMRIHRRKYKDTYPLTLLGGDKNVRI